MSVLRAHHDTEYINVSSQHHTCLYAIRCIYTPLDHQRGTELRKQNSRAQDRTFPLWRVSDEEMTSRVIRQRPGVDQAKRVRNLNPSRSEMWRQTECARYYRYRKWEILQRYRELWTSVLVWKVLVIGQAGWGSEVYDRSCCIYP